MADDRVREEVFFSGRVQGVGFRQTTSETARRFAVTGFVENLADGRVRAVVEGTPAEISRFLQAVEAELERYIVGLDRRKDAAGGEFADFRIRH
jgi:acylphosphatase